MNDDEFLEASELMIFTRDILSYVENNKTDNALDFSLSYFKAISSCQHIIGGNFPMVLESHHNRSSLIYLLIKAFQGFDDTYVLTINELHCLFETIIPGFPRTLMIEAAFMILDVDQRNKSTSIIEQKLRVKELLPIIYCYILYDEWLKFIEEVFRTDGKNQLIPWNRLRLQLQDSPRNLPSSIQQPPQEAITAFIEVNDSKGSNSVSLDDLKSFLFIYPSTIQELEMLESYPSRI